VSARLCYSGCMFLPLCMRAFGGERVLHTKGPQGAPTRPTKVVFRFSPCHRFVGKSRLVSRDIRPPALKYVIGPSSTSRRLYSAQVPLNRKNKHQCCTRAAPPSSTCLGEAIHVQLSWRRAEKHAWYYAARTTNRLERRLSRQPCDTGFHSPGSPMGRAMGSDRLAATTLPPVYRPPGL
jgi:hypothetical protein